MHATLSKCAGDMDHVQVEEEPNQMLDEKDKGRQAGRLGGWLEDTDRRRKDGRWPQQMDHSHCTRTPRVVPPLSLANNLNCFP